MNVNVIFICRLINAALEKSVTSMTIIVTSMTIIIIKLYYFQWNSLYSDIRNIT